MKRPLLKVLVVILTMLVSLESIRFYGLYRLAETLDEFVDQVPLLLDNEAVEDIAVQAPNCSDAKGLAAEALSATKAGDLEKAMSLLGQIAAIRDRQLSYPRLGAQVVGIAAGIDALSVISAILAAPGRLDQTQLADLERIVSGDTGSSWSPMLADMASTVCLERTGGFLAQHWDPYPSAMCVGLLLGMYRATQDLDDEREAQDFLAEGCRSALGLPGASLACHLEDNDELIQYTHLRREYLKLERTILHVLQASGASGRSCEPVDFDDRACLA